MQKITVAKQINNCLFDQVYGSNTRRAKSIHNWRHLITKTLPTNHHLNSKKGGSDCEAIGGPQAQEAAI